jgi:pimeloyl-ACP methyl ester carboxylesterase
VKVFKKYFRVKSQVHGVFLGIMGFFVIFLQLQAQSPFLDPALSPVLSEPQSKPVLPPSEEFTLEDFTIYAKESANSEKRIARKGQGAFYPNAEANIIICHGFMCDKYDVAFLRRLFPRGRFNVLTFDFRAHGEERGSHSCTFGRDEIYDVEAAVNYVKNHPKLKGLPCIAYGFSMGAASAIEAQARNHSLFDAMILDCPFDSSENIIKQGLDGLKVSAFGYEFNMPGRSLLQKYAFHPHVQAFVKNVLRCMTSLNPRDISINMCRVYPGESIKKVSVPCLFIHCKNDERISVDAARNIYNNAASGYKILRITDGKNHFGSYFWKPEEYTTWVREFLDKNLDGTARTTELKQVIEE